MDHLHLGAKMIIHTNHKPQKKNININISKDEIIHNRSEATVIIANIHHIPQKNKNNILDFAWKPEPNLSKEKMNKLTDF